MAQIMFETFNTPAMYISLQDVLSLYTTGKSTGCVLDSGDGMTSLTAVFEGCLLSHAMSRHDFGGYELPDGNVIVIGNEQFKCPEVLFQKSFGLDTELPGIHGLVHRAITSCDINVRRDLFANIVLAGGNTMFPGLAERLTAELTHLVPSKSVKIGVTAPLDSKYSVWVGGSILASVPQFKSMWITKAEYDEGGPSVVSRKCL